MEALFSGPPDPDGPPQGLFSELWIGQHPDDGFTKKQPVIFLSVSAGYNTQEDLKTRRFLKDIKNK
jgi:hypothetical protein